MDTLFEQHRQYQHTGELLFSATVELMSVVAVGLRPSLHAALKAACSDGRVLASHNSVNFLRPAIGDLFIAKGKVVKPGQRQIFTSAELFAEKNGERKLVATGETILMTVSGDA